MQTLVEIFTSNEKQILTISEVLQAVMAGNCTERQAELYAAILEKQYPTPERVEKAIRLEYCMN